MKICSKCKRRWPLADYYRDRRATDGLMSQCKHCKGAYNRAWNKANRDSLNRATVAWRARNPGKVKTQKQQWRNANPDKVREQKRASHKRHATTNTARVRQWQKDNPEKRRAHHLLRRGREAAAAGCGYTTAAHIAARSAYYGHRCRYCGAPAESTDHRIPLSRGGSHLPANLVPACRSCNSSKNTKTEREYLLVLGRG